MVEDSPPISQREYERLADDAHDVSNALWNLGYRRLSNELDDALDELYERVDA